MRNVLWVSLLVALALSAVADAQELTDHIVAIVGKTPIFQSYLDRAVEQDLYDRRLQGEPVPSDSAGLEALRGEVLQAIIDQRIVIAKAEKESVEVTPTEIEDGVDQWIADIVRTLGSDAALQRALEREGLTLSQWKDRSRQDVANRLVVSKFMSKQFGPIPISEGDASRFFQNKYDSIPSLPEVVGIAHILITPRISPRKETEVGQKISSIRDRIKKGEEFSKVARETSDDEMTRARGGDIGLVGLGDLQPDVAGVAAKLGVGQVSEPFRTGYGIEIVKLEGKSGDKYQLRHIFVRFAPDAADTAKALGLAEQVRSRLAGGESFEALAREYSEDQTTKEGGGYLGEIEVDALDAVYAEAIAPLKPGEMSQVINTPRGLQILKLVSRTAARKPSYEEAKPWIRRVIESRRRQDELTKWLEAARQDIYVERFP